MHTINVQELRAALADGSEIAVLDVREVAGYIPEHLLFAVNLPLSRFELQVDSLVPRRSTRIVVVDAAGELATEAAQKFAAAGYTNVSVLCGGTRAWKSAGSEVYFGRNTPGVVFGEVLEHQLHTPNISAARLQEKLQAGDDVIVLDTRPRVEFDAEHIPGAIRCAGSELAFRAASLASSPETQLVVNCGGRTRAILGAQGLINLGIGNPVAALTGGTMEWVLNDFTLEVGPGKSAPLPSSEAAAEARRRAATLAHSHEIQSIDLQTLRGFEKDTTRSVYRFDVRSSEEYQAGHLPGFRSAPDGELFSRVVKYIGTWRARVVLFDSEAVRDLFTAGWLIQQGGYEVYVLRADLTGTLESGAERTVVLPGPGPSAPWIDVPGLQRLQSEGSVVIFDIDLSSGYDKRHIAGAAHSSRRQLSERIPKDGRPIVITSSDGVLASVAASELRNLTRLDVRALLGGTRAWVDARGPTESGGAPENPDDVWKGPGSFPKAEREQRMRAYLDWELSLVAQHARDPSSLIQVRAGRPIDTKETR
jgi:rhodanese-related sulfurtransferase